MCSESAKPCPLDHDTIPTTVPHPTVRPWSFSLFLHDGSRTTLVGGTDGQTRVFKITGTVIRFDKCASRLEVSEILRLNVIHDVINEESLSDEFSVVPVPVQP